MSLIHNSFFCPLTRTSLTSLIPQQTSIVSFSLNPQHKKYSVRNNGKAFVLYKGFLYFTSPCHPLELELSNYDFEADVDEHDHPAGVGILKFFKGTNIFITAATGLVGKVLVEKILRSTAVGKVYVLIKAEDKKAALDRLKKEIIGSELYKSLKEMKGKSFDALIGEKLIPVVGNICEPNLGMDSVSAEMIQKDVDVIIASAANTTFDERYDLMLDANVTAPQRLMRFAKTCKNLKLFTLISTAFVNGRREGIIYEKPLIMGENARREDSETPSSFPRLDVAGEIQLAFKLSNNASSDYDATKDLKRLGQERAEFFGWSNTYHMTKAMGEMVLNEIREDIPLLIIRPTIIESVYNDPLPGWIQGNRMSDPVIISYGKGQLPAFLADPNVALDILPVDIVANVIMAAVAKHGAIEKPQVNVYHVSSSAVNPLTYLEFFEYLYEFFSVTPLVEGENISRIKLFENLEDFTRYTLEEMYQRSRLKSGVANDRKMDWKLRCRCKAKAAYAGQVSKLYKFVGFFKARFHTGNIKKLLQEMSEEEKLEFEVDASKIDWRKYFQEIHIPGLRKHVING